MKTALPLVALGLVILMFCSCFEGEPAEISVATLLNGQPQGCQVQLWNTQGRQLTEETGDASGIAYLKQLQPGTYILKFVDSQKNKYPAEITVTVKSNDSQMRRVELSDPTGGLGTEGS